MWIRSVHFYNFTCHKDLYIEFQRGLIGLIGRNGAGKSTILSGLLGCLTGDFSRFNGVKADLICSEAKDGEQSFVEVEAEHNGIKYRIKRSIRPNKQELKIEGEDAVITKDAEIAARLSEDLGVDRKLISSYAVVAQNELTAFLSETASERANAFSKLCRTSQSRVIYDAIGTMLAANQAVDVVDNSDELTTMIGEANTRLKALTKTRESFSKVLLGDKSKERAQGIVKKREKYLDIVGELETLHNVLAANRDKLRAREEKVNECQKLVNKCSGERSKLEPQYMTASASLKNWDSYEKRRQRRESVEKKLQDVQVKLQGLKRPKKPKDYEAKDDYRSKLFKAMKASEEATNIVHKLGGLGSGTCPTCLQEIKSESIDLWNAKLAKAQSDVSMLEPIVQEFNQYETDMARYTKARDAYAIQQASLENELESFGELNEPEVDKESLEETISAYRTLDLTVQDSLAHLGNSQSAAAKAKAEVDVTESRIKILDSQIEAVTVTDELYNKACKRLAEHNEARKSIYGIDGQIAELTESKKKSEKALDNLRAVLNRRKKLDEGMKLLASVRDVFHWRELPLRVARANMMFLERDINEALEWFGSPFWVKVSDKEDELGFIVHKAGGDPRPAESLSGGEKAIFAVAFRRAINALFRADIGTMWLDEPTANLDSANLEYFQDALQRLAAEVRGNRQLVVVTHAEQLLPAFDQVVRIGV